MRAPRYLLPLLSASFLLGTVVSPSSQPAAESNPAQDGAPDVNAFKLQKTVVVPLDPEDAFDAFTGDITDWWDHSFAKDPAAMRIEARPGGAFIELFDDEDNGALHATVTYAQRGKKLTFVGPLGLAQLGTPIEMVHTLTFEEVDKGTKLIMNVSAMGLFPDSIAATVGQVWEHFLSRYAQHIEKN